MCFKSAFIPRSGSLFYHCLSMNLTKLHHLKRNVTLLKMPIESVGIYIRKMPHRAKALVELLLKHSYTSTFVIYVLYIVALRHKDDHHKRTHHHLQSEYRMLQSLACKIGTSLCIQTAHCTWSSYAAQ